MISIILILGLLLYFNVLMSSLEILAIAGIITVVGYKYKNIFKQAWIYYVIAVILTSLSVYFYDVGLFRYFTNGYLGYSFIFVVMFCGVTPNKWGVTRNLKKNRGVFSILGFILISSHAITHIFGLLGYINLFGIAAYVIMVPLTLISFRIIRKEINPKDWFRIQKAAYLVYIVLFIHLLMISSYPNKIIYAVLLTLYVNNKLYKELRK